MSVLLALEHTTSSNKIVIKVDVYIIFLFVEWVLLSTRVMQIFFFVCVCEILL